MTCGIYKIENKLNGHCYIGQSINIEERWKIHKNSIYNCIVYDYPLYKAIRKYGIENFSFEIIEECIEKELNDKEVYWIKQYNSFFNGYNQTMGGQNAAHFSKISKEQLLDIIKDLQEKVLTETQIADKNKISLNMISMINLGKVWYNNDYTYPIRDNIKKCKICGNKIEKKYGEYCNNCYQKITRKVINRPSREELKNMIYKQTFTSIGEKYQVKDNTIRKWCKSYKLPYTKKEINSYTNEEWQLI